MVANNYRALRFMREEIGDRLTPEAVLALHKVITDGTLDEQAAAGRLQLPGEERVAVFYRDEDKDAIHRPPPAETLPERMEMLCDFANESEDSSRFVPPVVRAILVHFWLSYDHPFLDGNGRTARILFFWVMRNRGYELADYLPISRLLRAAPAQYARAFLEVETDGGDTTYFLLHQLRTIEKAIEDLDGYLGRKRDELRDVRRMLDDVNGLNGRQIVLLTHAIKHPDHDYTIGGHALSHRVTHETARADLGGLADRGLLTRHRRGRSLRVPSRTRPAGATERIRRVSANDAYAKAGVDQGAADSAVAGLVRALGAIQLDRPSAQVPLPGHYASVIKLDERTGIALSTDGVGTKLVLAEQLGRFDTVGIDCVAMNVNDVICVGAEPLAMLDYIAIEQADPAVCEEIGVGLARGAEQAGIEIPGGELAQLGQLVRGVDVSGACFGTVALEEIVDGSAVVPGDVVIGLPSTGLHSNGYTLARSALAEIPLDDERLGRPLGDVLLEPTEIYVKPIVELLRSEVDVRGLAHITSGGTKNLLRLAAEVGYEIDNPLPVPPVFGLIQEHGAVSDEEMSEVFNMGCGFCVVVPEGDAEAALSLLRSHYPAARPIGRATDGPRRIL